MFDLSLSTRRIVLRPLCASDGPRVREFAGAWDVAKMLSSVPHPYPEGLAESWIATHDALRAQGEGYHFAIVLQNLLIGIVSLERHGAMLQELGYWLGIPYWGQGYATEAAEAVLAFGFNWLAQEQVTSRHMVENGASARVLAKLGFAVTGRKAYTSRARAAAVDCIDLTLTRGAWAEAVSARKTKA